MTQSGGATKVLVLSVVFLLGSARLLGIGLGDTELLNPSKHAAEVEAIRVQTAYEERQRNQQLALEEEKARILTVARKQTEPGEQANPGRGGMPVPELNVVNSSSVTESSIAIELTNVKDDVSTYDGILAFVDDYYIHPHSQNRYYHSGIEQELAENYVSILHSAEVLKRGTNGDGKWVLRDHTICVEEATRRIPRQAFEARMAA